MDGNTVKTEAGLRKPVNQSSCCQQLSWGIPTRVPRDVNTITEHGVPQPKGITVEFLGQVWDFQSL